MYAILDKYLLISSYNCSLMSSRSPFPVAFFLLFCNRSIKYGTKNGIKPLFGYGLKFK